MIDDLKNEGFNLLQVSIHLVIAFMAGVMKGLHKIEDKGFKFTSFVANAAVSAFAGIVVFFLLAYFEVHVYLAAFATSIAGWLGGNALDFLGLAGKKAISDKLGTTISVEEEKAHSELINN